MNTRFSNENLFKLYYMIQKSLMIYVVIILYYQYKGLNFTQIMILNAIISFVTLILEIPSGIIADLYSRKKLIFFGLVNSIFSLFIILFAKTYLYFIFAAILMGISSSAISGADIAYIYDYFKNNGNEDNFKNYFSKLSSKQFIVIAISTFISGSVFSYNPHIPIIMSIIFQSISLIAVSKFKKDSNINKDNEYNISKKLKEHYRILKQKNIFRLIIIFIIMTIIISNLNYLTQPYLVENNIDLRFLGVIFLSFNMISSYGAKKSNIISKLGSKNIIFIFAIILLILSNLNDYKAIVIFLLARFLSGSIWPALNSDLNKLIDSKNRASIMSYKNLMIQIVFIFLDPLVGFVADYRNIHFVYLVLGLILITYLLSTIILSRLRNLYYLKKPKNFYDKAK